MKNENIISLPEDKDLATQLLASHNEREKIKIDRGILGHIWGNSSSVPNNIAALTIVILLITGVIYSFLNRNAEEIRSFWTIISPILTLCIGYLFGEHTKNKKD